MLNDMANYDNTNDARGKAQTNLCLIMAGGVVALAVASSQVSSSTVTKSIKPTNAREIFRGLVSLTHYQTTCCCTGW